MESEETAYQECEAARVRMLANLLLGALIGLAVDWMIW